MKNKIIIPTLDELISANKVDLKKEATTILLAKNAGVSKRTLDKIIKFFLIRKKYYDELCERSGLVLNTDELFEQILNLASGEKGTVKRNE